MKKVIIMLMKKRIDEYLNIYNIMIYKLWSKCILDFFNRKTHIQT